MYSTFKKNIYTIENKTIDGVATGRQFFIGFVGIMVAIVIAVPVFFATGDLATTVIVFAALAVAPILLFAVRYKSLNNLYAYQYLRMYLRFITSDREFTYKYRIPEFELLNRQKKQLTVRFLVNGQPISEQSVARGKPAKYPKNPEKEGYVFVKWDHEIAEITEDIDVKPIFIAKADWDAQMTARKGKKIKTLTVKQVRKNIAKKRREEAKLPETMYFVPLTPKEYKNRVKAAQAGCKQLRREYRKQRKEQKNDIKKEK